MSSPRLANAPYAQAAAAGYRDEQLSVRADGLQQQQLIHIELLRAIEPRWCLYRFRQGPIKPFSHCDKLRPIYRFLEQTISVRVGVPTRGIVCQTADRACWIPPAERHDRFEFLAALVESPSPCVPETVLQGPKVDSCSPRVLEKSDALHDDAVLVSDTGDSRKASLSQSGLARGIATNAFCVGGWLGISRTSAAHSRHLTVQPPSIAQYYLNPPVAGGHAVFLPFV